MDPGSTELDTATIDGSGANSTTDTLGRFKDSKMEGRGEIPIKGGGRRQASNSRTDDDDTGGDERVEAHGYGGKCRKV